MSKTYLVTGGAGFLGSNVAAALRERYPSARVAVCDFFGNGDKWRNLTGHPADEIVSPTELFYWMEAMSETIDTIFHFGAISSTTERNADLLVETNFTLPKILRAWCAENRKRLIYASSGSTYGAGEHGFIDEESPEYLGKLRPLNTYAWSKCTFDYYVARTIERGEKQPAQSVGLKFFNVYGPNEYHKGDQKSVLARIFPHAQAGRPVHLFKSYHPDYPDGGQLRDFVYAKDCVDVVMWFLENPDISGLYNVGTGKARSFADLANALFTALDKKPQIIYESMPIELKERYQYFTEANMERLRAAGYDRPFHSLEDGVKDYVQNYLNKPNPYL